MASIGHSATGGGELDGPYERYDEHGRMQARGTMSDGEFDGRWEEYYENGQLKAKGE